jgi:hypothetical protein
VWVLSCAAAVAAFGQQCSGCEYLTLVQLDDTTRTVYWSLWRYMDHDVQSESLFRTTLGEYGPGTWKGRTPPVLREGLTYWIRDQYSTDLDNDCRCWMLRLGDDVAPILGEKNGELTITFDRPTRIGEDCEGTWQWSGGAPKCIEGSPQKFIELPDVWREWSDRDKLSALHYLYINHVGGWPAASPCFTAKDAEARHRCAPFPDPDLDGMVAIAHNVDPPPELSPVAQEYYLRAKSETVKSQDDVRKLIDDYGAAIGAAPWFRDAYYNRGLAEAAYGLYLYAIADFQRYLELNPSPDAAAEARARIAELK